MSTVIAPAKSYVVEFIIAASCGNGLDGINTELFGKAVELVQSTRGDDSELDNIADVYDFLVANGYGVDKMFDCPVTEETVEAYAAYMTYAI